jgi:hypothetical protein
MQSLISERIELALDNCHSIHVWSSSPRTTPDFLYAALDTSAYAAFQRIAARVSVTPPSFTGNPGPSWAILSRPYGTDRDLPGELICFQRVRASKKLIWTRLNKDYSARKAATGSRFEASTAGSRLARIPMTASSAIAKPRVARS